MAAKVQLLRSVGYFVSNEHYVYMCKLYILFMRYWFFICSVGFSFLWSWNRIVSYNVSYDVQQLAMLTLVVESFIVSIARLIRSSCRFQKKFAKFRNFRRFARTSPWQRSPCRRKDKSLCYKVWLYGIGSTFLKE